MSKSLINNQILAFQNFSKSFYSKNDLKESVHEQVKYNKERLSRYKKMVDLDAFGEQFFFVVNLATELGLPYLSEVYGVENTMGYSNFSIEKYFETLSPIHLQVLTHFAFESLQIIHDTQRCNPQMKYVAQLPIRASNGKYFLVKRTLLAFEWTSNFKVKSYFNHFYITRQLNRDEYEDLILNFKIDVEEGKSLREDLMELLMKNKPDKILPFSERELQVLKEYIIQPNANSQEIGKTLGISRDTVLVHNKQLLSKAEDWLEIKFKDARQLSDYLKNMSLA